ncbi:MAG: hypothetical protein HC871_14430, partial [Rhizobiales bacterium]|nr:hypothetical protein [Hyphomicrobiales bacterium]
MVHALLADVRSSARPVRHALALIVLPALLLGWQTGSGEAEASDARRYHLVTGQVDSTSYVVSVGISSLVKVRLLPTSGLDIDLIPTSGLLESFSLLRSAGAHFAIIGAVWSDLGSVGSDIRGVATIWQDGDRSIRLLARQDVDEEAVYEVTKAIFENLNFLSHIDSTLEQTSLDRALEGMSIPLHDGARRYFEQVQALPPELIERPSDRTDNGRESLPSGEPATPPRIADMAPRQNPLPAS